MLIHYFDWVVLLKVVRVLVVVILQILWLLNAFITLGGANIYFKLVAHPARL